MGRMAGFSGRELRRVAESLGWEYQRTSGDHMVFQKAGVAANLSIPAKREVAEGTARSVVKNIGLSVDVFLAQARK